MKPTIRELTKNDDIRSLIEQSNDCDCRVNYSITFEHNINKYLNSLGTDSQDGNRYVICDSDKIVGISGVNSNVCEDENGNFYYRPFLTDTLILSEYRGEGYGTLLLNHIKDELSKKKLTEISCFTNTAVEYYVNRGFVITEYSDLMPNHTELTLSI